MRRTLRILPVLAALVALGLPAAPAAAAEGGAAACTVPFEVARAQQLGELSLEKGRYKLTVLDTSDQTCDEANDALRDALREPGAALPDGWKFDAPSRVFSREDGTDAMRIEQDHDGAAAGAEGGDDGFWGSLEGFALTWLPIIFMGLLALAVVWMVQYMPRTKPQEIAPSS
jgi:hypothetical protein